MKRDPLGFLLGLALGIIFVAIVALAVIDVHATELDYTIDGRTIEVFPEPVTVVVVSYEPIFVQGLAKGDPPEIPQTVVRIEPSRKTLTKSAGRVKGPTNVETYYNLPMSRVVQSMRNRGYSEDDYPYWVRDDGCKMLGDFIIVAADLDLHPKGTVVQTSLGQGLVCDTGEFTEDIYDIATDW